MKICLIGKYSGYLNEGYGNIAFNLSKELSRGHDVLNMDVKKIYLVCFWRRIKEFKPHIIHYLTAPTLSSFIALQIAKIYCNRNVKLVISSLHPYSLKLLRDPILKKFIPLVKPDLILTQSSEVETILRGMGCDTKFLPNGIDTKRFTPVSVETKEKLREKYGIHKEKFVILHVGHIRNTRGIEIFSKIQKESESNQVLIVGSLHFKTDKKLCRDLVNAGCTVWNRYFEKIEEIYALSDCYVFPTMKGNSIFMPLSVLEAMSCNLPVFSIKHGGLVDNFGKDNGLIFLGDKKDLCKKLSEISRCSLKSNTRKKILSYSWEKVGKRLECIYSDILLGE